MLRVVSALALLTACHQTKSVTPLAYLGGAVMGGAGGVMMYQAGERRDAWWVFSGAMTAALGALIIVAAQDEDH
jgi:hypothetical protein